MIMRQDKGRGVTILNRKDYIHKCLGILNTNQFRKLETDPTKTLERKIQRTLRKIKHTFTENDYKKLYPTGSRPGLFYGTPKVHKLKDKDGLKELTMRPIISNIGTATYETAKYLNKLFTPLTKSKYSILNTDDLISRLKIETIPDGDKMISFDVKSLFTNVPLERTIEIILKKVYDEKKINTNIPKSVLKELLYLCTKHLHFTFNNEIYIQIDGVAMGSPLGPLLANIFMTALEEDTIPSLNPYLCHWKRFVDDTHAYIDPQKVESILNKLNDYHPNIEFTFELEENNSINFLDVNIKRISNNKLETTVYRKTTNTDIYINWNSHAPSEWCKKSPSETCKNNLFQ